MICRLRIYIRVKDKKEAYFFRYGLNKHDYINLLSTIKKHGEDDSLLTTENVREIINRFNMTPKYLKKKGLLFHVRDNDVIMEPL